MAIPIQEGIIIPEIILLDTVNIILKEVRDDYDASVDPNKHDTILYRVLGGRMLERYNFLDESESVFLAKNTEPRHLKVDLYFNRVTDGLPTIHISTPSETLAQAQGIGLSEGYNLPILDDDTSPTTVRPVYSRRFAATYYIVITSDNTNEIMLIWHLLRALLIPIADHLNMAGLINRGNLSGKELQLNPDIVPEHVYAKAIGLEFEYDVNVPILDIDYIIRDIVPQGKPNVIT